MATWNHPWPPPTNGHRYGDLPTSEDVNKLELFLDDVGVSNNRGTPKSSILIRFSIIFTIHFGVPLFLETPMFR